MLFFLLLIVPFASAYEEHSTDNNRCANVTITVPDTPCPKGKIKCPSKYVTEGPSKGCPTEITCDDMWFSKNPDEDKKNCMAACGDVSCAYGEILMPSGMIDTINENGGFGKCDRMQEFCAKFPEYPGIDHLTDFYLGFHPTNVDKKARIVWPQSCGADEIWCHLGFDNDGHWLGSWCAKNATECEDAIEGKNTDVAAYFGCPWCI